VTLILTLTADADLYIG